MVAASQPDRSQVALWTAQVDAVASARQNVTDQSWAQVYALLIAFHAWYSDKAVRDLAEQIAHVMQAAQATVAASQDGFLSWLVSQEAGRSVKSPGQVRPGDLRPGVDPVAVYERFGETYRFKRSVGRDDDQAVSDVLNRARTVTATDIALAERAQSKKTLASVTSIVKGYRRVVHPELSRGGTCGLCLVASDQIYKTDQLLPIHANCVCTTAPVMRNGSDPGNSLNNLSLQDLYGDAGSTASDKLKRTRYKVDEHGELGAVLKPKKGSAVPRVPQDVLKNRAWVEHQIAVTEALKDSPWRTTQLARLRKALADLNRAGNAA